MKTTDNGRTCDTGCWLIAGGTGALVAIGLNLMAGMSFIPALVLGLVAFLLGGIILTRVFCGAAASGAERNAEKGYAPVAIPVVAPVPTKSGDGPAGLTAARGGVADDLKRIKGIGPKLEAQLNRMGFFHFDQVLAWTAAEVAWVDENLEGFKGRVTRDNWVEQAKLLAAGAETEFSTRVDKGEVY